MIYKMSSKISNSRVKFSKSSPNSEEEYLQKAFERVSIPRRFKGCIRPTSGNIFVEFLLENLDGIIGLGAGEASSCMSAQAAPFAYIISEGRG